MGMGDGWLLEVARAIYSFKATVGKTLSFREHEQFLIYHPSTKEKNWWQVVNRHGQVGYVPSNYVTAVEVSREQMRELLCELIHRVETEASAEPLPSDRQELLNRLHSRLRRLDGHVAADEKALSRTPSIISIPPVPSHAESAAAETAPPVPPHKTPLQPPPPPSYTATLKRASERTSEVKEPPPPVAEKTVSVKRRVAQLASQLEGSIAQTQGHNTGTIKRNNSTDRNSLPRVQKSPPGGAPQRTRSADAASSRPAHVVAIVKEEKPSKAPATTTTAATTPSAASCPVVTEQHVYQLVEQVRRSTELSHELSRVAVGVVVEGVAPLLRSCRSCSSLLNEVVRQAGRPLTAPEPLLGSTHDAQRLQVIFSELTSCKDDAQQRSWMLHEDEHVIIEYIKELTSILTDGDSSVCKHVVSSDGYSGVAALVQYYQMETRWSIRQPLLTAMGVLCGLDPAVISLMLSSVLPCELARDMTQHPAHVSRVCCSALLLTMLFSMAEPMPVTHHEQVGVEFIKFVLDLLENPPESDVEEQIPELMLSLLLSYNLQFSNQQKSGGAGGPEDAGNPVVAALAASSNANAFTQKILMLLNREDDPVRVFSHEPPPPHSVLKLCVDVFSCSATAALFYTNDVKVLIEIIVRQLADLSPGDPLREQYLWLARVVLRTPGYAQHRHRRHELHKCFTRIFCEEADVSRNDQRLVREISNEFPHYFKA